MAALPLAAHATPSTDGRLVVLGTRTSYVDLTLKRPTTDGVGSRGYLFADFTTRGSYAGYVLRPLDRPGPRAAGHLLQRWSSGEHPQGFQDYSDGRALPAGRYRLYLITDGATRFSITLPGYGEVITARPTRSFPASFEYRELGPHVGLRSDIDAAPFVRTPLTHLLYGFYYRGSLPIAKVDVEQCLTRRGSSCDSPDAYHGPFSGFCNAALVGRGPVWMQCMNFMGSDVAPDTRGPLDLVTRPEVLVESSRFSVFRLAAELV